MRKHRLVISLFILVVILGYSTFRLAGKNKSEAPYPEVKALTQTDSLVCDEISVSFTDVVDDCDGKRLSLFSKYSQEETQEKEKHQDLWRRDGENIYIKRRSSMQIPPHSEDEQQYQITFETDTLLMAAHISEAQLATSSSTLFLDKTEGLLLRSDSSTIVYCREGLVGVMSLYLCKE